MSILSHVFTKIKKKQNERFKKNISISVAYFIFACLILIIIHGQMTAVRCTVNVFILLKTILKVLKQFYFSKFLMRKVATAAD